jgi:hypothetical protein
MGKCFSSILIVLLFLINTSAFGRGIEKSYYDYLTKLDYKIIDQVEDYGGLPNYCGRCAFGCSGKLYRRIQKNISNWEMIKELAARWITSEVNRQKGINRYIYKDDYISYEFDQGFYLLFDSSGVLVEMFFGAQYSSGANQNFKNYFEQYRGMELDEIHPPDIDKVIFNPENDFYLYFSGKYMDSVDIM